MPFLFASGFDLLGEDRPDFGGRKPGGEGLERDPRSRHDWAVLILGQAALDNASVGK